MELKQSTMFCGVVDRVNKEFYENIPLGTHLFGRFSLLEVIAASDLCGVYKVLSTWGESKGKVLALKITSIDRSTALEEGSTPGTRSEELILKEIHLISKVKSNRVVQAFDWFQDDLFLAYSMEYMAHGSIESVLSYLYQCPIQEALPLLTAVAEGLSDIHRVGIIHRDIKPQNILISDKGEVKIGDFGIAERMTSKRKNDSQQITGTIDFVSPEYIKNGRYDHRSDIYAWGILSYLALTGHVPFEDESVVDALSRKASEDPISPRHFRSEISHELDSIILKAIARDPEDRFDSMDDIVSALKLMTQPNEKPQNTFNTTLPKAA